MAPSLIKLKIGELSQLVTCWCNTVELAEKIDPKREKLGLLPLDRAADELSNAFYAQTNVPLLTSEPCYLSTDKLQEWIEKKRKELGR